MSHVIPCYFYCKGSVLNQLWFTKPQIWNKWQCFVNQGTLKDGTQVAIKRLAAESKQGADEFLTEIDVISNVRHPNLVKLIGCCVEGNNRLLVYEYAENNSLSNALLGKFNNGILLAGSLICVLTSLVNYVLTVISLCNLWSGPKNRCIPLNWQRRAAICTGTASGLAFLHEEAQPRIVHRDIKASNILLDKKLLPKIGDFGLAKLFPDAITHISTRVAGTM
jgi:serine/threonine protein kinase